MGRQADKSEASVTRALEAALGLFSSQGFRATSMREIAAGADLSVGNLYHHFPNKEALFQRLIERYWERLTDPALPLNQLFARASFPDDLPEIAAAIEAVVDQNIPYILLIYVDVIEFGGEHIRAFYANMAERFEAAYGERFERLRREGRIGDVDPLVAVMVATRWFFYFFTVEKCFGVPMHFGMSPRQAVGEFIRLLEKGILPRAEGETPPSRGGRASGNGSGRREG